MKKVSLIGFFAAVAMMMVACGGGSGSSGNSTDSPKEEPKPQLAPGIPSELAGTVWISDHERYCSAFCIDVYFMHEEGDTIPYRRLYFLDDKKVVVSKVFRYYDRTKVETIESIVCDYTYDAPTGRVSSTEMKRILGPYSPEECSLKVYTQPRGLGDEDDLVTLMYIDDGNEYPFEGEFMLVDEDKDVEVDENVVDRLKKMIEKKEEAYKK